MNRLTKRFTTLAWALLAAALVLAPVAGARADTIRVAGQTINESEILTYMAKHLIEANTPHKVDINTSYASAAILHAAMQNDEIDLYMSWTGTQLTGVLRYEGPNLSGAETFKRVKEGFEKEFGFTWLKPIGFNDTYVMAVRKETAEKYHLKNSSDLAKVSPKLVLAGDESFDTRSDCYPGWAKKYDTTFKEVLPMSTALVYTAIDNKEVDVIAAYSTDSRVQKLNLVLLDDDKEFFPDYSTAYIVPLKFAKKYPEVIAAVEKISGMIDERTMISMNLKYDEGGDPSEIAMEFLKNRGLLK